MSCEHCGCDCDDYEAVPLRLHNSHVSKGDIIEGNVDGLTEVEVVRFGISQMSPEDLLGLPFRKALHDA